jgi:hypothetical protein
LYPQFLQVSDAFSLPAVQLKFGGAIVECITDISTKACSLLPPVTIGVAAHPPITDATPRMPRQVRKRIGLDRPAIAQHDQSFPGQGGGPDLLPTFDGNANCGLNTEIQQNGLRGVRHARQTDSN